MKLSLKLAFGLLTAGGTAMAAQTYDSPPMKASPAVQQHVDLAYFALNGAVSGSHLQAVLYGIPRSAAPSGPQPQPQPSTVSLPAAKAFDQLYFLGHGDVCSWALVTSAGIVIIDSLNTPDEAEKYIVQGLRSFHLDPAQIKYVIVTHGHRDHFGGSGYLQSKYHARVMMSAVDWDFAAVNARDNPQTALATRDMEATDGGVLTVGNTQIRTYVTPGHTPGTLSLIFGVTDKGRPHVVSLFGGYGTATIDRDVSKGGFATMRNSLLRFGKASLDAGADVIIANHTFNDASDLKAAAVVSGKAVDGSPWIAGKETVHRFYVATIEAVTALETYFTENPGGQMDTHGPRP